MIGTQFDQIVWVPAKKHRHFDAAGSRSDHGDLSVGHFIAVADGTVAQQAAGESFRMKAFCHCWSDVGHAGGDQDGFRRNLNISVAALKPQSPFSRRLTCPFRISAPQPRAWSLTRVRRSTPAIPPGKPA